MIKRFADSDSVGLSDMTKQKKTHLRPVLLMESHMVGSVSQNFFPIFSKTAWKKNKSPTCKALIRPAIHSRPEWSDHKWTAPSAGENSHKTRWSLALEIH